MSSPRVTPTRLAAFADFVGHDPREEQLRSPLLLAVFFGDFLPGDSLRRLPEEYRLHHQRRLAQLQAMLEALGEDRRPPSLVALRGASYQRLVVEWIGQVLREAP